MSGSMAGPTAEMLVDAVVPSPPVISPDGRWVAYTTAPAGAKEPPESALWVAAADASTPPRMLTSGTISVDDPRWAPDSGTLFFLLDKQLHRISLEGGDTEALTSWRGGISGHLPLADGRLVAIIAPDETDEDDPCDPVVWGENVPYHRLRLLDLALGTVSIAGHLGDRHLVEMVQRPDGGPLAVVSWDCPDLEPGLFTVRLHVVDPATGDTHDLGHAGLDARAPAWWQAADGWHVCYLAETPPTWFGSALFSVAADGTGEHRNLTTGLHVCPGNPVQTADGPPLALFADGLDTALYRLDPHTERFQRVSSWQGHADGLSASSQGAVIAARVSTTYDPRNIHAGPLQGPLVRLSDTRPELREISWGVQERLPYKAADGLALEGLLILPPGKSRNGGPLPLVTLVHGGPYGRYADEFTGNRWPMGQWLATAGYAVFLPNPRGSEGRGHVFAAMVASAVGMDEWTDILSGIDLLVANGIADPDRLGIGGWSHGGFMTAWAVGQTDRFKAALMGAGISDWSMQVGVGELGTAEADLGGSCGWESAGPHPHDLLSPISYASRIRTPVLILHGAGDTNVPIGQATYFHRALRHFGVKHEFVVYPREGHNIAERAHQIDLLQRTRAWFDRWLR
jgi:dipeptidyl aminopeptidase/acylaminoacyl peptidase